MWYKSKTLLPRSEQPQDLLPEEEDPKFDIYSHHLLDYSKFKQAAKELAVLERQQEGFYARGADGEEAKKPLGIDHISLEDLSQLFQQILAKSTARHGTIEEEEWKVADKIDCLCDLLVKMPKVAFTFVFNPSMGRMELIVTFLALLEMMKLGDARVVNDGGSIYILRTSGK